VKKGATAALLPLLSDGEWHPLAELAKLLSEDEKTASEMASQMRLERMGLRGRDDQQVRWRPDLYLESDQRGHEKSQFTSGADSVLKGLLGLRSFQQLIVQPGQLLNPAQRYWLDRALKMTGERIADGGD
jgi:hypothetical protein